MIMEFLTRLRFLILRKDRRELEQELQFHIEQSIASKMAAGLSATEARRQALIEFGGIEPTREQCERQRPGWWIGTVLQDVRYELRGFRRNPLFTISVLLTLALGIGATTAVFSVVDRILFRPLPYADPSRIVSLGLVHSLEHQEFLMGRFYVEWQDNQRPFSALAIQSTGVHNCDLVENNPQQLNCISFQAGFLPLFGISPILGRNFLPEEDRPNGPRVVMISYGLWKGHYNGDPHILDKMIDIDGNPARVVGVMPKEFQFPTLETADIIFPMALNPATQQTTNGGFGNPMRIFARLRPGVSVAQAYAEMQPLFDSERKLFPATARNEIQLSIRSLRDRETDDVQPVAWVLFGFVICGFIDRMRKCSRLNDGARRGAATGNCGARGDRCEPRPAHPTSAYGSTPTLLRGRCGGTRDCTRSAGRICQPCTNWNPFHQQSPSGSSNCRVHSGAVLHVRCDVRTCVRAADTWIGYPEREDIDVSQPCFSATHPCHCADRSQHNSVIWCSITAAQFCENRGAESRNANRWRAHRTGRAALVPL